VKKVECIVCINPSFWKLDTSKPILNPKKPVHDKKPDLDRKPVQI